MSPPSGPRERAGRLHIFERVRSGLRSAARRLRRLPDRLLHPTRRRRARRRLQEASPTGPVLFVCHGNICRSPYAEAALRRRAEGRLEAASAGLFGPDRPAPETAREVAGERGVDLRGHRSRLLTHASLQDAGLVAVMDPAQQRALRRRYGFGDSLVLGDLDPGAVRRRPIRDPVFQAADVFREVYARIDRCVDAMLDALELEPGSAANRGDGRLAPDGRPASDRTGSAPDGPGRGRSEARSRGDEGGTEARRSEK